MHDIKKILSHSFETTVNSVLLHNPTKISHVPLNQAVYFPHGARAPKFQIQWLNGPQ
jgi:hypothetical protein